MELTTEWIDFDSQAGSTAGYLARPSAARQPSPGVVVLQEVWGADCHILDLADRFATAGYVTLAPDLYSAGGGRPAAIARERVEETKRFLDGLPQGQWMTILADETRRDEELGKLPDNRGAAVGETMSVLFQSMRADMDKLIRVTEASVSWLRGSEHCAGGKVATIGYCLGGSLSAQVACRDPELGAAVIYYGGSPGRKQVSSIRCPVRGFYGEDDPRIVEGLPEFESALQDEQVDHQLRVYPGTGHAFFNDTRPSYQPHSARDAWGRTLAFFAGALDPVSM